MPPPYSIEQAVTDEQAFWTQIREMIGEAVHAATADATLSMKTVAANQAAVVDRVNDMATKVSAISQSQTRLENLTTKKTLLDDHLRERIAKLCNLIEHGSSAHPTPPAKENGGPHD